MGTEDIPYRHLTHFRTESGSYPPSPPYLSPVFFSGSSIASLILYAAHFLFHHILFIRSRKKPCKPRHVHALIPVKSDRHQCLKKLYIIITICTYSSWQNMSPLILIHPVNSFSQNTMKIYPIEFHPYISYSAFLPVFLTFPA